MRQGGELEQLNVSEELLLANFREFSCLFVAG